MDQNNFLQIPDQIPFKKIQKYEIRQLEYSNDLLKIKLDKKCEGQIPQKQYQITRKISDFSWLLQQIKKQSPKVVVLPLLIESNWSIFQAITDKLYDQSKKDIKKWYQQQLICKMAQRFLLLIKKISLLYIYKNAGFVQSSLFTFLDTNYQLYKLQTYQRPVKQAANTQTSPSAISAFAQSLGKGGIKLLGMLNVVSQQSSNIPLKNKLKTFSLIEQKIKSFYNQQLNIIKSLEVLIDNFINQKKLKEKLMQLNRIYLRSANCLRMVSYIISEIRQIDKKVQQCEKKSQDKQIIQQQIALYQKFTQEDLTQINKEFQAIVRQYYTKCFEDEAKIQLSAIYPSKM